MGETHEDITGVASGLVTSTQQLGGAPGLGVLGTVAIRRSTSLTAHGDHLESALTQGFHLAFQIGSGLLAVGAVPAAVGITARAGITSSHADSASADRSRLAEIRAEKVSDSSV